MWIAVVLSSTMDEVVREAQASLVLQYRARLPPQAAAFGWPEPRVLLLAQQGLDSMLFSSAPQDESTVEYDRSFLKHLVKRIERAIDLGSEEDAAWCGIEKADWAVEEALLERYVELLAIPGQEGVLGHAVPQPIMARHYFPVECTDGAEPHPLLGPSDSVVLREEGIAISRGTTGLRTWEASLRLAGYLVLHAGTLFAEETRVLELGSGAGFLGLVCARLLRSVPNSTVTLTDLAGQVLERLQESAQMSMWAY